MATSKIPNLTFKLVKYTKQITWYSTSNPYCNHTYDVTQTGYIPIAVGYSFTGTGSTTIYPTECRVNGNNVLLTARMVNTPDSTTQNGVNLSVLYAPTNCVADITA